MADRRTTCISRGCRTPNGGISTPRDSPRLWLCMLAQLERLHHQLPGAVRARRVWRVGSSGQSRVTPAAPATSEADPAPLSASRGGAVQGVATLPTQTGVAGHSSGTVHGESTPLCTLIRAVDPATVEEARLGEPATTAAGDRICCRPPQEYPHCG